jgi:iron complex transport system permease protein
MQPLQTVPLCHQRSYQRQRLSLLLLLMTLLMGLLSLITGSEGVSIAGFLQLIQTSEAHLILLDIRAPRTLGAYLVGALLGLSGAVAQGLFRNPLADPYLLGAGAGASLGVMLVLVSGSALWDQANALFNVSALMRLGLMGGAFVGALSAVLLTLGLARGAAHTTRLLLAGVIVAVVLSAAGDLLSYMAPETLRDKQAFLLGSTSFLSWSSCVGLAAVLLLSLTLAWCLSRVLDALSLGVDSAISLGIDIEKWQFWLVIAMALGTAMAVSQAGLIAFVGLVSPHLVRRYAPASHGYHTLASAGVGGCLLLGADVLSRLILAPQELPVGVLTALLGGGYLLCLLYQKNQPNAPKPNAPK